jgi:outer membrane protein assembly factor BamE (lipoprotein component of BamABCDE complex)
MVALPAAHTPPSFDQLPPGTKRSVVDSTLGVPARTIGTAALYPYTSLDHERKVMAGYFDVSGKLQRFERYVLKDGKVFGEVSETELNEGRELPAIRLLLAGPTNAATGLATPPAPPAASH